MLDTMSNIHDTDFYTWTQQQAGLLRQGCLTQLDIANLIDEIEDMGRSEKRELIHRLAVLLAHLLKWQYQPSFRSRSWRSTIKVQRFEAQLVMRQNPGLKSAWHECLHLGYSMARLQAADQTSMDEETFPTLCPWTMEQIFNNEFWPGDATC